MNIDEARGLRAVQMWDAWGRAIAAGGDLTGLIAAADPRIVSPRPVTRVWVRLSHGGLHGQLCLELRVDFAGAPRAERELDGVTRRANAVFPEPTGDEWSSVLFAARHVEFKHLHESVPKLMDAVYARSSFIPRLHGLDEVARVYALATGRDVARGTAHRIAFERRGGQDIAAAYHRMGFALLNGQGLEHTEADQRRWESRRGPNAGWPRDVAWRRGDDCILDNVVTFGADARRILGY